MTHHPISIALSIREQQLEKVRISDTKMGQFVNIHGNKRWDDDNDECTFSNKHK